jgi:hypothetical protein
MWAPLTLWVRVVGHSVRTWGVFLYDLVLPLLDLVLDGREWDREEVGVVHFVLGLPNDRGCEQSEYVVRSSCVTTRLAFCCTCCTSTSILVFADTMAFSLSALMTAPTTPSVYLIEINRIKCNK